MNDIVQRQAPALALGETLLRLLTDPNISAEKTQILLTMQKEIMAESRREQFQAAFAEMSVRLPHIDKRGLVRLEKDGRLLGTYRYAKWEDMDEVIRPIMHEFGFSLTFASRIDDKGQILVGKLMHRAGHFEISERRLEPDPGPGRNKLQAEGSGLSYAKRYLGEGLLNLVRKDMDDDGIAAGLTPLDERQLKELTQLLTDTKTAPETFMKMFVTGCETIADIPSRDFVRLKNALEAKKASLAQKNGKKDNKK